MKEINVLVDEAYKNKVKAQAASQGLSIKSYIMELIDKDMKSEKEQKENG